MESTLFAKTAKFAEGLATKTFAYTSTLGLNENGDRSVTFLRLLVCYLEAELGTMGFPAYPRSFTHCRVRRSHLDQDLTHFTT